MVTRTEKTIVIDNHIDFERLCDGLSTILPVDFYESGIDLYNENYFARNGATVFHVYRDDYQGLSSLSNIYVTADVL